MSRGRYRIQMVSEMTGVPAATLRAWERRYGIPSPERTESSYRLYSDRDVELIQNLRGLCEGGMAPAEAARQVHRTLNRDGVTPEADPFATAGASILGAVDQFDPRAVEFAVRRALFLGAPSVVFEQILVPVLRAIGERWRAGTLSVGQEHLASEVVESAVRDMLRLVRVEDRDRVALLACFADEDHVLPLYGVALHMARWGFRPVVLGARTPPAALKDAVVKLEPALVGLSVSLPPSRERELVGAYADACADVPWVVGGAASEALREPLEAAGSLVVGRQGLGELKAAIDALVARHQRAKRSRA